MGTKDIIEMKRKRNDIALKTVNAIGTERSIYVDDGVCVRERAVHVATECMHIWSWSRVKASQLAR